MQLLPNQQIDCRYGYNCCSYNVFVRNNCSSSFQVFTVGRNWNKLIFFCPQQIFSNPIQDKRKMTREIDSVVKSPKKNEVLALNFEYFEKKIEIFRKNYNVDF
jgi:hypothetical protein